MSPDTIDLLVSMFHALVVIASIVAVVVLLGLAWEFGRRRDVTERAERARVLSRVGLDDKGKRLPPDDDPIFLAGQRAIRKERRMRP